VLDPHIFFFILYINLVHILNGVLGIIKYEFWGSNFALVAQLEAAGAF
jgi:hypothetical protein